MQQTWRRRLETCVALVAAAILVGGFGSGLRAQHGDTDRGRSNGVPRCTNLTASGTYGYQMTGVIVGVGPFLVNGIYTHHPNGTMDADVQLVVGDQSFPLDSTGGSFQTNRDCTGSGKFPALPLLPEVTYNFIVTDGGDQIELLNTNPGVVLHGISRRLSEPGRRPQCRREDVEGTYGYRLDGSGPGVPNLALAGVFTEVFDRRDRIGTIAGHDTFNVMGQYLPRTFNGTFTIDSNCRGAGFYIDSLGREVNYVFTAVNDGDRLYIQSNDRGAAISGVAQRVR